MFTKRQLTTQLLEILGRAFLAVVVAMVAIYFLSGQISAIGSTARENRTAVTILENKNQVANDLKNGFASIGDGDKKVEEAFIKAENIVEFINKLEDIAKNAGLEQSLRFYTPGPLQPPTEGTEENKPADELKLMEVDYDINLKGSAASLVKYLEEFEKLPYFSKVVSINLNSSPALGWEKDATISVKAQLYLR